MGSTPTVGGPSFKRNIGRWAAVVEAGVAALVLLSCGGGDPATPSPTPARLSEPDQGDERPIAVRVRIVVADDAVTVRPRHVAAFLPLNFVAVNHGRRPASVRAPGVPIVALDPGANGARRTPGLEPGRYTVKAGRGRTAPLRVVAGG